jgi:hypothetical protein
MALQENPEKETHGIHNKIWYLEKIINEDKKTFSIAINKFPFHIGRNEDCELSLPSRYISKYHAEIIKEGNVLKIVDLGSVNGVFLNYKPVTSKSVLKDGDILHFNKLLDDTLAFRVMCKKQNRVITEGKTHIAKNYGNRLNSYFKGRKRHISASDFNFSIGLPIYIEIRNKNISHLKANLFSWKERISLTIDLSEGPERKIEVNDRCVVRFSYDGKVFGFETLVQDVEDTPSPHIVLKYPELISYIAYRRYTRYQTNLRAIIRKSLKDKRIDCRIIDISFGGCRVAFSPKIIPDFEGEVFLTMVNLLNDLRVVKVHEERTESGYLIGFRVVSYGGAEKKRRFEEILNFHAPVKT